MKPVMVKEGRDYLSFLLRLWRLEEKGKSVWRASVESSHTGEKIGFGSLDELFEFLRERTGAASDRGGVSSRCRQG